jgi:hypothetical protein
LLEQDVDIRVIQTLWGHAKLDTTALYIRVANTTIRAATSPLDRLAPFVIISGFQPSAIPRKPSPANAAAPSNTHRPPSAHRFPARSFFGGFPTPAP